MHHESARIHALLSQLKPPAQIDLSLDTMLKALEAVGNPHLRLPPVVHVAGTNGKGSTIAFLRAMLEAAGYRCHVYTSPHLIHFHERIVLAGHPISDDVLEHYLAQAIRALEHFPLTFFEATTLAAFLAFAETPADVVLLEVGLGGRLDATNVVPCPALSIITPVGIDHCEFLGATLSAIAVEKSGILKARCPAVIAPQPPDAMAAIHACAHQCGATLHAAGAQWHVRSSGEGLEFTWQKDRNCYPGSLDYPNPLALRGEHQRINAATALAASYLLESQWFIIDDTHRAAGLAQARWPARLQHLVSGPLAALLPEGWQLFLDGGHNADAATQLARWAAQHPNTHAICAMTAHKDAASFLKHLRPEIESLQLVPIINEPMAMPMEQLCTHAREVNATFTSHPDIPSAIGAILHASNEKTGYILICGSLYLAGQVLHASGANNN